MADRSLVLDANILLRAVLGKRGVDLIECHVAKVGLFASDTSFDEVEEHLAPLAGKAGMPVERAIAVYDRLGRLVQELPHPMYGEYEAAARARIEHRRG